MELNPLDHMDSDYSDYLLLFDDLLLTGAGGRSCHGDEDEENGSQGQGGGSGEPLNLLVENAGEEFNRLISSSGHHLSSPLSFSTSALCYSITSSSSSSGGMSAGGGSGFSSPQADERSGGIEEFKIELGENYMWPVEEFQQQLDDLSNGFHYSWWSFNDPLFVGNASGVDCSGSPSSSSLLESCWSVSNNSDSTAPISLPPLPTQQSLSSMTSTTTMGFNTYSLDFPNTATQQQQQLFPPDQKIQVQPVAGPSRPRKRPAPATKDNNIRPKPGGTYKRKPKLTSSNTTTTKSSKKKPTAGKKCSSFDPATPMKLSCPYPECAKKFIRPYELKVHVRSHTGEKPYVCPWPLCSWKFSRGSALNRHMRTHSGDKPYVCPSCFKKFKRSDDLCKHRREHLVRGELNEDGTELIFKPVRRGRPPRAKTAAGLAAAAATAGTAARSFPTQQEGQAGQGLLKVEPQFTNTMMSLNNIY